MIPLDSCGTHMTALKFISLRSFWSPTVSTDDDDDDVDDDDGGDGNGVAHDDDDDGSGGEGSSSAARTADAAARGGNKAAIDVRFKLMDKVLSSQTDVTLDSLVNELLRKGDLEQLVALAELLKLLSSARRNYLTHFRPLEPSGTEHVAKNLNNIAMLLQDQGKLDEALPMYQRGRSGNRAGAGRAHRPHATAASPAAAAQRVWPPSKRPRHGNKA